MLNKTFPFSTNYILFFALLYCLGINTLKAQSSKISLRPKIAKGDVFVIKTSITKKQVDFNEMGFESEPGIEFQVDRDYNEVPIEAIEDSTNLVKPSESVLEIIDENKDFYICKYSQISIDINQVIGEASSQLPLNENTKGQVETLLKKYNDSVYLDFKLFKNNYKIEVIDFAHTQQRLTRVNLWFVHEFKEIVLQPLLDSYKSMISNYEKMVASNNAINNFEITFEGFEEETFVNSNTEPDFSKIMEFSIKNMFNILEITLTQDLKDEESMLSTRYTVLEMIFGFSNREINMGDYSTINFPLNARKTFHNVGVHTLKSVKSEDTISISGNWFLSDEQKLEMKKTLIAFYEIFFNGIFNSMGIEDKIVLDNEISEKEVKGKGELKLKFNSNNYMPYYISRSFELDNLLEISNFTMEIVIEKK